MCGICGQYNFTNGAPVDVVTIRSMAAAIAHRGPDDEGYFVDGAMGLGFRRLSIIDLAGGHQPMSDVEETVWVVFNGEIYNFVELREELQRFGHQFRTRSDTEVIIHGYKQWGTEILNRLNGMFGLAIWDVHRRKLVLARDSAGIKLIYYHVSSSTVTFGSELRAVLAALPRHPDVDITALNQFLRYRYTPSPLTAYSGVRKLAPGTMATFESGSWSVQRWHRVDRRFDVSSRSDREVTEQLLEVYGRALKRHLISDVPVGLLLSGGVDSGLLLSLMRTHGDSWPTYSVGYGKSAYKDDELGDAAETAKLFNASNVPVLLTKESFEQALPRIVSVLEEPIAASSTVPMYFVCERARHDVKVALMGQGPDELMGGYMRHLGVHYGAYWRRAPASVRRGVEAICGRLPRIEALRRGFSSLDVQDRIERYQNVFSIMPGTVIDGLFRDGVLPEGAGDRVLQTWSMFAPEIEASDELGGFQLLEVRSSLPDELLMYADKLSMAHGLEVRVPYLDREVIEFAASLPASFKIRHGQRKWLHRKACETFLPSQIVRRKKRGFAVNAVNEWFNGSLNSKLTSYLLDGESLIFRFLRAERVGRLLEEHRAGQQDNHKILFSLVMLEEWLRINQSAQRNPL